MKRHLPKLALFFLCYLAFAGIQKSAAQVYMEKQSRHRFAQMTVGLDLVSTWGGTSHYFGMQNEVRQQNWSNQFTPRLVIGGTHFWGHAHFALGIPLVNRSQRHGDLRFLYQSGVETAFQYFPWRLKSGSIRPFVGLSFLSPSYHQQVGNEAIKSGPTKEMRLIPLSAGFCFTGGVHHVELGVSYLSQFKQDYYINQDYKSHVELAPWSVRLSYRYNIETTLSAERTWESGLVRRYTDMLAEDGKLNNFFFGIGLSTAFSLKSSPLNTETYPWMEKFPTPLLLDLTAGYYWHKPDFQVALNYRGYSSAQDGYGIRQEINRKSLSLEAVKFLGDYHGFVPFAGPIVSLERLDFRSANAGTLELHQRQIKAALGLSFGWDIRPNRIQSWLLRTNLRWYPKLQLGTEQGKVDFSSLEFNFIQLVLFPGRM